jgi:tetratricopeptide (TPR) repeat protein
MFRLLKAKWHFISGRVLGKLNRYEAAAAQLEHGLTLSPQDLSALCLLGWCHYQAGKYQLAADAFDRALQISRDCSYARSNAWQAYLQLAVSYGEDGCWDESLTASEKLVDLLPTDAMSHVSLSAAYHALERWRESADACSEALTIDPHCLPALEGIGYAYLNLHCFPEAQEMLTRAISLKSDNSYTHAWLAHAYAGLGDEKAARGELRILEQLDQPMAREIGPLLENSLRASPINKSTGADSLTC